MQPRVPGHIEVFHNAEIISAAGTRSAQRDLVLADRSTPPLLARARTVLEVISFGESAVADEGAGDAGEG
ncbi:hypothetical protein [Streptomyces albidoflavus]|uniref:hypothetical protein n=1 Tax=Streptomyces albidoflavus TaxID=1886 RepID=UPI00338D3645